MTRLTQSGRTSWSKRFPPPQPWSASKGLGWLREAWLESWPEAARLHILAANSVGGSWLARSMGLPRGLGLRRELGPIRPLPPIAIVDIDGPLAAQLYWGGDPFLYEPCFEPRYALSVGLELAVNEEVTCRTPTT